MFPVKQTNLPKMRTRCQNPALFPVNIPANCRVPAISAFCRRARSLFSPRALRGIIMPTRRFVFHAATLSLLAGLVCIGRFVPARPANADAKPPPPSQAKLQALYQEKCSACHNLPDPQAGRRTRAQWQRVVTQMLTRYHASDEITAPEAAQIVDYLATFAPDAPAREDRAGPPGRDPWATDAFDVWANAPAQSRVFNFEAGPGQPGLSAAGAGVPGPPAVWHTVRGSAAPDGAFVKVVPANPSPSRFALLVDQADTGRDLDVRVRFQIAGGRASPSVGLAFGLADTAHYSVLRFDAKNSTLSLLKISPGAHTVLQTTLLTSPFVPAATLAANAPLPPGTPGWHTLRLLVNSGRIRGWIDGMKRISASDPAYAGGKVALWSQGDTIADFDDWTADFYDGSSPAPPRA